MVADHLEPVEVVPERVVPKYIELLEQGSRVQVVGLYSVVVVKEKELLKAHCVLGLVAYSLLE